jgi:hypothetical protein
MPTVVKTRVGGRELQDVTEPLPRCTFSIPVSNICCTQSKTQTRSTFANYSLITYSSRKKIANSIKKLLSSNVNILPSINFWMLELIQNTKINSLNFRPFTVSVTVVLQYLRCASKTPSWCPTPHFVSSGFFALRKIYNSALPPNGQTSPCRLPITRTSIPL